MSEETSTDPRSCNLHIAWLMWVKVFCNDVGTEIPDMMMRRLKAAFYCGAFHATICDGFSKSELFKACEDGMSDACEDRKIKLNDLLEEDVTGLHPGDPS